MPDETTDESNTEGKEDNSDTPKPEEHNSGGGEISELDRAEAINKEKAALLEREEKLVERKEKLKAIEIVGGRAIAGRMEEKNPDQEMADKLLADTE